jgi:hypothetical protein
MITGKCECGSIQYEVNAEITDFSHCHCSQCRRLHGAAFATFAGVNRDSFHYVSGESTLKTYASSEQNDRVFCGICGSNILVDCKPEPQVLYLAMGTVNGEPERPPGYHQFVGSKASWFEINDKLLKHDSGADE